MEDLIYLFQNIEYFEKLFYRAEKKAHLKNWGGSDAPKKE